MEIIYQPQLQHHVRIVCLYICSLPCDKDHIFILCESVGTGLVTVSTQGMALILFKIRLGSLFFFYFWIIYTKFKTLKHVCVNPQIIHL